MNFNVSGVFDFNNLGEVGKQVLLDLLYPVGSYFSNDSEEYNTVEKVESHFGGKWERITGKILYATEDDNGGTDSGSNFITLTTSQIPSHNHTFTGDEIRGSTGRIQYDVEGDIHGNGCFSITSEQNYWNKNGTGTRFSSIRTLTFSAKPTGTTNSTGSGAQIDIRPARRNTYCYHRIG